MCLCQSINLILYRASMRRDLGAGQLWRCFDIRGTLCHGFQQKVYVFISSCHVHTISSRFAMQMYLYLICISHLYRASYQSGVDFGIYFRCSKSRAYVVHDAIVLLLFLFLHFYLLYTDISGSFWPPGNLTWSKFSCKPTIVPVMCVCTRALDSMMQLFCCLYFFCSNSSLSTNVSWSFFLSPGDLARSSSC